MLRVGVGNHWTCLVGYRLCSSSLSLRAVLGGLPGKTTLEVLSTLRFSDTCGPYTPSLYSSSYNSFVSAYSNYTAVVHHVGLQASKKVEKKNFGPSKAYTKPSYFKATKESTKTQTQKIQTTYLVEGGGMECS